MCIVIMADKHEWLWQINKRGRGRKEGKVVKYNKVRRWHEDGVYEVRQRWNDGEGMERWMEGSR